MRVQGAGFGGEVSPGGVDARERRGDAVQRGGVDGGDVRASPRDHVVRPHHHDLV